MSNSNQTELMAEVMSIMALGEAPWQELTGNDDRLANKIESSNISNILEQFDKALNGHPALMEVANNRLHGDLFSRAINAKPHVGLNALLEHGAFEQMLDVAEREGNLDELGKAVALMEQATKTRLTQMGFEEDAFGQVDQTMREMTEKLNARDHDPMRVLLNAAVPGWERDEQGHYWNEGYKVEFGAEFGVVNAISKQTARISAPSGLALPFGQDNYASNRLAYTFETKEDLSDFLKDVEKLAPEIEKIQTRQKEHNAQIPKDQEPNKKTEFDQLVSGQNLVIEKAVDDGMSYVGTVAGEDGGTVIVKVGDHRAVAMSKARMEGEVEVGENSRFGYEKQYGNDERGRAIRDKNIELGGQRYAVIDMDDLVQQNRRSIMGKVLAVEPDGVYTQFGKNADGQAQVVAHNPAKLDVIPALGSFATLNYGANGLGKLAVKEQNKGLDQQIER